MRRGGSRWAVPRTLGSACCIRERHDGDRSGGADRSMVTLEAGERERRDWAREGRHEPTRDGDVCCTRQDARMGQSEQVLAERSGDVIFPLFEIEKTKLKNALDDAMFDDGRAKTRNSLRWVQQQSSISLRKRER